MVNVSTFIIHWKFKLILYNDWVMVIFPKYAKVRFLQKKKSFFYYVSCHVSNILITSNYIETFNDNVFELMMKLLQNFESYFLLAKAQEVVQSSKKLNSKWKPKYFGPSTSISLTLCLSLSLSLSLSRLSVKQRDTGKETCCAQLTVAPNSPTPLPLLKKRKPSWIRREQLLNLCMHKQNEICKERKGRNA